MSKIRRNIYIDQETWEEKAQVVRRSSGETSRSSLIEGLIEAEYEKLPTARVNEIKATIAKRKRRAGC